MRMFKVTYGDVLKVGLKHTKEAPRETVAWVRWVPRYNNPTREEEGIEARAKCAAGDNFCKRTGRHLAVARLMKQLGDVGWCRGDRKLVADALSGKYATNA